MILQGEKHIIILDDTNEGKITLGNFQETIWDATPFQSMTVKWVGRPHTPRSLYVTKSDFKQRSGYKLCDRFGIASDSLFYQIGDFYYAVVGENNTIFGVRSTPQGVPVHQEVLVPAKGTDLSLMLYGRNNHLYSICMKLGRTWVEDWTREQIMSTLGEKPGTLRADYKRQLR